MRIASANGYVLMRRDDVVVFGSNNWGPGGHGVGEPPMVIGVQVLSACVVRALPLILALSETLEYLSHTLGSWTLAIPV